MQWFHLHQPDFTIYPGTARTVQLFCEIAVASVRIISNYPQVQIDLAAVAGKNGVESPAGDLTAVFV